MSTEIEQGKAIEVATMLGDSVVDVKHCMDPRSGKVSSKTWALLATGALCVLVSGIAFYISVTTAAYNASALDYWTTVAHKPAFSYRPELLSGGYDWLAFGGFGVGIVTLVAALLRVRDERRSPYYRVGTAPGVEQPVVGAPTESFPLIAPSGDDFVFNFARGISGEAIIDGRATSFAELAASGRARPSTALPGAYELPLVDSARIRATIGQTSFLVASVARPRRHATPLFTTDSKTLTYFAGSLGAHLALVLLLAQIPVDGGGTSFDISISEMTYMRATNNMSENVPPEPVEHDAGGDGTEGTSAQMALAEGMSGTTATNRKDGHIRIKQKTDTEQLARAQAIEAARTAGVLGVIGTQNGDVFASLTESGNLSSGFDMDDVRGPLFGAEGQGQGYFGYGRIGFGAGGGCSGVSGCDGIIGTEAGYGRIGLGKFGRNGYGGPGLGGGPGQRRHTPGVPNPIIGQPTGTGDLDKSIIRRYIKRNIDKIKYCYEKQLLAKPGLAGSVNVSFFITPMGSVKGATGGGMDATVANCVADVVSTIEFPKPTGGGVQVNYPFTFQASGAGNE